jgi:hypothetical protein
MGDPFEFKDALSGRVDSNGVVVIRSLIWPGAYTLYSAERGIIQIYAGDGHKFDSQFVRTQSYYPTSPPTMCEDP